MRKIYIYFLDIVYTDANFGLGTGLSVRQQGHLPILSVDLPEFVAQGLDQGLQLIRACKAAGHARVA